MKHRDGDGGGPRKPRGGGRSRGAGKRSGEARSAAEESRKRPPARGGRKSPPRAHDAPEAGAGPEERGGRGRRADGGEGRGGGAGRTGGGRARGGRTPSAAPEQPSAPGELRLQAYLARAGVASRRASEELIREGRVTIDGEPAELGAKVPLGRAQVRLDGRLVELRKVEWVALHKPTGYVTTRDDPNDRRTVYDLLPAEMHHLFHVGRLDRDSSGLLLLTNDGEGANRLLHPRYGTSKEYLVDVEDEPEDADLEQLVRGVELDDGVAQAVSAVLRGPTPAGTYRIELVMREGRRREVRRMLEAIGFPVRRLFRRRFGPIEIGKLRPGHWRYLTAREIQSLR